MKMNRIKRSCAWILALMMIIPFLYAAGSAEESADEIVEVNLDEDPASETQENGEAAAEKDGWHFDSRGFLTGSNPGDEYLFEDEENGQWQYASADLAVKITRVREKYNKKKMREYCVAEIWASEKSPMKAILSAEKGKWPEGVNQVSPELLVEKHPCVFAMSDDFFGSRQQNILKRTSARQPGIIIRNGEVRWEKTKAQTAKTARQRPCLDTLAVYSDGSMKTYLSDAMTAEEYLEKGALQVFAFGP